jgi:hypothetical protein
MRYVVVRCNISMTLSSCCCAHFVCTHTFFFMHFTFYVTERTKKLQLQCIGLILDFKLSLCFEYCMCYFGYFPGSDCEYSTPNLWRWNWQRVPKRRQITIWRRGNTQKNIYTIGFIDYVLAYRASMNIKTLLILYEIPRFSSENTKYFDGYNFEIMYYR